MKFTGVLRRCRIASLFSGCVFLLFCVAIGLRAAEAVLPALNTEPGPEYADSKRMFQGIPTIEHASNGRLWAAWYGGGVTEDKHNYIILETSADEGKSWQRALVLDPDREGPVRAFDPCLWHDPQRRLWLFWAQRNVETREPYTLAIHTTQPGTSNPKWSTPVVIQQGIMMNKPLAPHDNEWLLPVALWRADDSARVVLSANHGATFKKIGAASIRKPEDRNCDEHMIVQRQNGALWMLVRTGYGIGESLSMDGGKSWSDVVPSKIPHPVSRFFIRRLKSGNLLMIRHDPPESAKARSHLKAFISADDGASWEGGLLLDERPNVSYPDAVQATNGLVYAIYDWERRLDKEILMARFREEDVKAGKLTSADGGLRLRINKATGLNPTVGIDVKAVKTGGRPLSEQPGAGLEFSAGEPQVLQPGAPLFLDRPYTAMEVPGALRGCTFLRMNITGGRLTCAEPGVVYLLTPSAGRQRDSQAKTLLERGFEMVNLPEFMLFEGQANVCTVFQKQLKKGETLDISKWAVPVLPKTGGKMIRASSIELAGDAETFELWDRRVPFPAFDQMRDLPCVTHVEVERAEKGGYHYLHEPAIAWHDGRLYAGWANHRLFEINVKDELLRGRVSRDGGLNWEGVSTWAAAPVQGGESFNHPVLFSSQGKLWGFFTRWQKEKPRTEIFLLSDDGNSWVASGHHIPGFIPFTPPRKMDDGNWIMSGELHWYEAAVVISRGDDLTRWDIVQIPRPESIKLHFPETTLMEQDGALVAICRPREAKSAPTAISKDRGRTWTALRLSNFCLAPSKPLCGKLSNGQQYLITDNLEEGRALLTIAVTAPRGQRFCRIWKIRHQQTPKRRLLGGSDGKSKAGLTTEWSYPAAVEHEGQLYVIYTQGKEDCAMSIIPIAALE